MMDYAVDLGTTTIQTSRVAPSLNGTDCAAFLNPQRKYGSDVLSRMKNAASDDRIKKELSELIQGSLRERFAGEEVGKVVLSGNTAMIHLFFGEDVSGMLTAPFTPVILGMQKMSFCGADLIAFPAVSAFVGGDIVSGLYACGIDSDGPLTLFLDLGTNGELVLAGEGQLLAASVAAGPAFEGGNLSVGMAAVSGAIRNVKVRRGFVQIETIGDVEPKGLCGSGIFDLIAELLKDNIINEHGTLRDDLVETGLPIYRNALNQNLILTQDDIRAFQTAKAAVRAGIEVLLHRGGVSAKQITRVVISGSFGAHLKKESIKGTGLLPEELAEKAEMPGNTSLFGAKKLLAHPGDEEQVIHLADSAKLIPLAGEKDFEKSFIRFLDFQ